MPLLYKHNTKQHHLLTARASFSTIEISVAFTDAIFTHFISAAASTGMPPRKWKPHISPKAFRMMLSPPFWISSYRSVGSRRIRLSSRREKVTQMGW